MDDSLLFSVLKRDKFHEIAANKRFDFVFTSTGIKEALFALLASVKGYKCAILVSGDFKEFLHPIVDAAESDHSLIVAFRNQFPHLILPDEYLNVKRSISKWKKLLPGGIRGKDISKYESALQTEAGDAVYIEKEFKISTNRLLLSILKSAVEQGALVLNHVQTEIKSTTEILVTDDLDSKRQSYLLNYDTIQSFPVAQKLEMKKEIHFYLNKKGLFLKRSLKFKVGGKLVRMVRYQDYFLVICESQTDGLTYVSEVLNEINRLVKWENTFCKDDIIASKIVEIHQRNNLKNQMEDLAAAFENHFSTSLAELTFQLSTLPVKDSNFDGKIEIQQLIEFGDYRFDEAKQTGIRPIPFKNMFYRFGSEIEELTEKAYEWRGRYGPGDDLWVYVQFWYVFHNEMICTKEDYISRITGEKPFLKSSLIGSEEVVKECFRMLTNGCVE